MTIKDLAEFGTVFAAFIALPALLVTWLALVRNSQPQIMVYYQPSRDRQSIIELIIENIGNGYAYDIKFSKPIPVGWYGIDGPNEHRSGTYLAAEGLPALAPRQRYVFNGGQFGALRAELGSGIRLSCTYHYLNPINRHIHGQDENVLAVGHMAGIVNHKSSEQAIVDALDGTNRSTLRDLRDSIGRIDKHLLSMSTRGAEASPAAELNQSDKPLKISSWKVAAAGFFFVACGMAYGRARRSAKARQI